MLSRFKHRCIHEESDRASVVPGDQWKVTQRTGYNIYASTNTTKRYGPILGERQKTFELALFVCEKCLVNIKPLLISPVSKIIGKINGLYPFPGAFFLYKGERYKILKAEVSSAKGDPGVILNENFEIGCGENSIKVLEIQREGKKVQKIGEFMLGTQIKKGTNLNNA